MNEPPNSRYFAAARNGQPIVWITRSSGLGTRQTSFTPSAQTCGLSPSRPKCEIAALQPGESPGRRGALARYDESLRDSFVWRDLRQVRNMRQAFGRGFWLGGALAGAMTASRGAFPPGDARTEPDADQELIRTDRASRYPKPDGTLTFDKLSSVFLSGNQTRDDAPNHIRVRQQVPAEVAELWTRMCPAAVYEVGADAGNGDVHVEVTPSNCVQCGAITAKGGRLTPPEGGAGPEYKLT